MGADLAQRLATRTLELVDIPSVSRNEQLIAEYVRGALALELAHSSPDVLYARTPRRRERALVVLAGHLDTVPAQDNLPGSLDEHGVAGLGASDMKGGLAVMLELADWAVTAELELDFGVVFFTREELAASESPLPEFLAASDDVRGAELVIVLEPTDNAIHAGCLGNINARVVFSGTSAHSARPWLGDNAIHQAIRGLAGVVDTDPLDVEVDGLAFREVLSVVAIEGGIAANVIPDRASCTVNFRYAPSRKPQEAEARLRRLAPHGELEILSNSPPAHVVVDRPLVQRLREAGSFAVEPKQAWTPVAQFAEQGLDAVNLGPGATRHAHKRDERIETAELVRTFEALRRFFGSVSF